jgi:hypothetical protein
MGKIEGTVLTSLSLNRDNCLGTEIELLNSLDLNRAVEIETKSTGATSIHGIGEPTGSWDRG